MFKDYNRPVLQITQIPTQYLDTIKEWLKYVLSLIVLHPAVTLMRPLGHVVQLERDQVLSGPGQPQLEPHPGHHPRGPRIVRRERRLELPRRRCWQLGGGRRGGGRRGL